MKHANVLVTWEISKGQAENYKESVQKCREDEEEHLTETSNCETTMLELTTLEAPKTTQWSTECEECL